MPRGWQRERGRGGGRELDRRPEPRGERGAGPPHRSSALVTNSRTKSMFSKFQSNRSSRRRPPPPPPPQHHQRRRQSPQRATNVMVVQHDNNKELAMDGDDIRMMMIDEMTTNVSVSQHAYLIESPHPFLINAESILSPRADIWLFLFLSSCASTAALAVSSPAAWRGMFEQVALAAMGTSTVVALCIALAFRYRPSRDALTNPLVRGSITGGGSSSSLTAEFLAALGMLALWLVSASMVFRTSSYMAVARTEIWNTNLFFATWISASLASYLVADILTVEDARGLLPKEHNLVMGNAIARGWVLLFIASISLLAFSIALRSGEICIDSSSGVLVEMTMCQMTLVGIIFGILGMVMAGGYLMVCLLERKLDSSSSLSFNSRHGSFRGGQQLSQQRRRRQSKRDLLSSILAATSLISYSVNTAFVTAPSLQPGMSEPCNVYFSSWICFALSLYLCIRQAEAYLVPGSTRDVQSLIPPRPSSSLKKDSRGRIRRANSRTSDSTAAPSNYSDNEEEEEEVESLKTFTADEALTAMVDSVSEDGPMLFLPQGGESTVDASDIDDDASYPSVTNNSYLPRHQQFQYHGAAATDSLTPPQQQGREPHKPRSISPSGNYRAASVKSSVKSVRSNALQPPGTGSAASKLRPQVEPPESDESADNAQQQQGRRLPNTAKRARDAAGVRSSFIGTIDTRVQSKISTSSESQSRSTTKSRSSGSGKISSRRSSGTSPEGQRGFTTPSQSFHVDEEILNNQVDQNARGFFVGTVSSEGTSSYPPGANPLDKTVRRPQQQRKKGLDPSFRQGKDPSFRAPPPFQTSNPMMEYVPPPLLREETLDLMKDGSSSAMMSLNTNSQMSMVSTDNGQPESTASKSKSTRMSRGSKSRSRSGSRNKKHRSKSREGSDGEKKKSSSKHSKSSSNKREKSMKSSKSSKSNRSRKSGGPSTLSGPQTVSGPPTVSHDGSSGPPGEGPPTMSASGDSIPLGEIIDQMAGPQEDQQQPALSRQPSMHTEGDEHRPVRSIYGSPDNMSMVSEPTMDGFDPPKEFNDRRKAPHPARGPQSRMDFLGSNMAITGINDEALRYSHADTSAASSQTNDNKVLRQGAVDKMVMEALRQAQEARQHSHHDLGQQQQQQQQQQPLKPPPLVRRTPPSPPFTPGGGSGTGKHQRTSQRSGESFHGLKRSPHGSKSPHRNKPALNLQKQKNKRSSNKSGSGGGQKGSGSGNQYGTGSIHSFYSQSEATSFDAGDAFAC